MINILSNISRSKGNQTMKHGQSMKYTMTLVFFKNDAANEVERLVLDLISFFEKALYKVKASGQYLNFHIFW